MTKRAFIAILGLALLLRLAISYFLVTPRSVDTDSVYRVARELQQGSLVYNDAWQYYNNPPVWMWIIHFLTKFSSTADNSLAFISKLPFIFSDIFIGIFIYLIARYKKFNILVSLIFACLYLFNPLSVLISSYQGQQESLSLIFVLASWWFFISKKSVGKIHYIVSSALLLGIAATVKLIPLSLAPAFIIYIWRQKSNLKVLAKVKESLIFIFFTLLPLVLVFIPYLSVWSSVVERVFHYVPVYGEWGLSYFVIHPDFGIALPTWLQIRDYSFNVALLLLISYAILLIKNLDILESILIIFLSPVVFSYFISKQHLLWFVPFFILWIIYKKKYTPLYPFILFSIAAGIMMIWIYGYFLFYYTAFASIIGKLHLFFMIPAYLFAVILWFMVVFLIFRRYNF